MKIIKIIMLILTAVYPLFMTCLAGAGLIYNKSSYGIKLEYTGIFLILSGIIITIGVILCLSEKKAVNIISLIFSISGLILCLVMLYILCSHADYAGWRDNYTLMPVSSMYIRRILPTAIPACIASLISFLNIKKSRT